jgi:hypothetical protein
MQRRRQTGRAAPCSLNNVPIRVKRIVFEAMVKSKLLYGGDIWWTGWKDIGKLETVENDFIPWISGFQTKGKVSVSNLRKAMHMESVEDSLCIKNLM